MKSINMLSSSRRIKGQGVDAAFNEQVQLVKSGLKDTYEIKINQMTNGDINHYHTIDLKFYMSMPFRKNKSVNVAYVHFLPETLEDSIKLPPLIKNAFYRYMIDFYKKVDQLVVVNPYFIDVLKGYGIPKDKITYIPNYVSENTFYNYSHEEVREIKRRMNIPPDRFVVLGVGQVQTRKGVLTFLETAKRLPEVQFIWAGGFSFGMITCGYKELKAAMETPPDNVVFLGIIDRTKMNDIYNICDMLFLPSYEELFPMAVLETMTLGKPILLRDLALYQQILFDDYLKGSDEEDFTRIIRQVAEKGDLYREYCSKSCDCHSFYSEAHVLEMWRHFYDDVLNEQSLKRLKNPKIQ